MWVLRQVRSNALYDTLWLRCSAVCAAWQMTVVRGADGRGGVEGVGGRGYSAGYACGLWRIDGTTNRHKHIDGNCSNSQVYGACPQPQLSPED